MCGIAGIVGLGGGEPSPLDLERMLSAIEHRGPDAGGITALRGALLGHRRLAVLDLSSAGAQPMTSATGRFTLTYNGEIYNHNEIRRDLEQRGEKFSGHSDTEVLLRSIEIFGVEKTLAACRGMFAFGLWDSKSEELTLARDRCGEKPLYYGKLGKAFVFASELSAIRAAFPNRLAIDPEAVASLFSYSYIPAPFSIFEGIHKLPAGSVLRISKATEEPEVVRYWSHAKTLRRGLENPFNGSFEAAVDELERLLSDAVKDQMQADVPLGAFLSGGVDSSVVVALMQKAASKPVYTFSLGFSDVGVDEAPHARRVAEALGTRHVEHYVTEADALAVVERIPDLFSEPFADSSQIPTYLVSEVARRKVTVALSGDGGDELFSGYPKYRRAERFERIFLRRVLSRGVSLLGNVGGVASRMGVRNVHRRRFVYLAGLLGRHAGQDLAEFMARTGHCTSDLLLDHPEPRRISSTSLEGVPEAWQHMLLDRENYLAEDILTKVDRAAMGVSLETRAPLLDPRLVEFASTLPQTFFKDDSFGKRVLREVLYRHVPRSIVDRPKAGFSVPLRRWLKEPLREWALDLTARSDSLVDVPEARKLLELHIAGREDHSSLLWPVLTFLAWKRRVS